MNSETAVEYLHKLLDGRYENVDRVTFFGGEPTLCPDTIQAVCEYFRQAVSYGQLKSLPNYGMVTNGTLIDERMAKIIHDFNIIVTVSADGPEQINDLLRVDKTGAGTFQKMKSLISAVIIEFFAAVRAGQSGIPFCCLAVCYKNIFYVKMLLEKFFDGSSGIAKFLMFSCIGCFNKTDFSSGAFNLADTLFHLLKCSCPCLIYSMPNGEIYPCHFFTEYPEYRIAEYRENAFDFSGYPDVLNKLQNAYHTKNESCRECGARFTCPTCAANMIIKKNSICKIIRENQKSIVLECVKTHFK